MQLLITIQHRPYVFLFFAAFLVISTLNRGLARTALLLVVGFSVAFLSEFSSIRNGFPYGLYHYVYENIRGELILGGVPVWDSLSYVFIAYASLETASFFLKRLKRAIVLASAGLMMLLDIIIDPLAVRGDRWFLGRIFYYPEPGPYFGVPLSNFAGWFLVGLIIFLLYSFIENRWIQNPPPLRVSWLGPPPLRAVWLGPLLYSGIAAFNLAITFWIGEWGLGLLGSFLILTSAGVLSALRRRSSRV